MATYQEIYKQERRTQRRAAQDAVLRERHARYDLMAQDKRAKFERPVFSVVGEGTTASQDAFRAGYDRIDWRA